MKQPDFYLSLGDVSFVDRPQEEANVPPVWTVWCAIRGQGKRMPKAVMICAWTGNEAREIARQKGYKVLSIVE